MKVLTAAAIFLLALTPALPQVAANWQVRYSPGYVYNPAYGPLPAPAVVNTPPVATANGVSVPFIYDGYPITSGCPATDTQLPAFNVSPCRHLDYLTRDAWGPLITSITIDYTITGVPKGEPGETKWSCNTQTLGTPPTATGPAYLFLMIETWGDGSLTAPYGRWWSKTGLPLKVGHGHLTIPLTWSSWCGVLDCGTPAAFANALNGLQYIGVTFGGCVAKGHGVFLIQSGSPARFVVNYMSSP